ncbi:type II toxin-antitoxin system RelE/ParE family toxin [Roseibium sp. CAU 1637]|uniref:Type II toxin-antitoxin system RelE/ParE family toxin n=1 Tax=Roseibium limicola TaxID=2816037 RepID=A0A939ERZ1_9HYPH|nr:type II toxin-antitoxin system RelE/ParE family toxin [Roseibium limicola]MBO0347220.1 type II toxin-antitoxin system RelE/ParE family toxin [Roseibium limicola]
MIQGYRNRVTEAFARGGQPRHFLANLERKARLLLAAMDAATDLRDLRFPPGNRLHSLDRDRDGQWSVSINMQWRICFIWTATGPDQVEICDYH